MLARDVLAILPLEDGRRWIDAAHDFQRQDALAVLEGEAPYSFVTRARGASKTTDLAALLLSVLIAAEHRIRAYWLAADADQVRLALDVIAGFVSRTPSLAGRVDVQARRVLVPESGAVLEVLPADAPSAWGLTPHWLLHIGGHSGLEHEDCLDGWPVAGAADLSKLRAAADGLFPDQIRAALGAAAV
jgi:hypothetical protein